MQHAEFRFEKPRFDHGNTSRPGHAEFRFEPVVELGLIRLIMEGNCSVACA